MNLDPPSAPGGTTTRAVLFDLDGTFADTAPDLAYALNRVLADNGRAPLSLEQIRPHVSHGGKALIRFGFGLSPDDPQFEPLRHALLAVYLQNIARETRLFPGMSELLDILERRNIAWGVVTNKPAWLTDPLMRALGLDGRAACVVSGDTTGHSKPHPEPIYYACRLIHAEPGRCLYVGDSERDVSAGRAAGARTLVAGFGYLGGEDRPADWGADGMIGHPLGVLDWLQ
jgi:2-phosphoglycolate phosphatase